MRRRLIAVFAWLAGVAAMEFTGAGLDWWLRAVLVTGYGLFLLVYGPAVYEWVSER